MTPGEIFLRAGAALGGWVIAYGHALLLAVIPATLCEGRSDPTEMWFASAVLACPAAASARWLSPAALPWRDGFRWLALPLAPLLVYNTGVVFPYFTGVSLGDQTLCAVLEAGDVGRERAPWHLAWAPLQLAVLGGLAWRSWQFWRRQSPPER